ncbi:hydantoinase/carbamoylase family amidase [Pseudomonas sp. RIT-PI-AD]|uniref:hydantoinase/carbamoylase family amidase n=1 Tax=Pseudomonas sp. RIT-PI-AD TaxID=3035294 RepID=UPI0021DA1CC1|nr:hydantoinase/carbamoylase family amidase [Pseudomonas sp. RIT-PI-AD]
MDRSSHSEPRAPRIDGERLWRRHLELARHGALPAGGVDRPAFSAIDAQARRQLIEWGQAIGLQPSMDDIGNLFLRRPGRRPELPAVATGSHLDTQPTGGKFDGAYGVLAGLEVLACLHEAGLQSERDLLLVVWANEEGSNFAPTTMGSAVFSGHLALAEALAALDPQGERLGDSLPAFLAAHGDVARQDEAVALHAFIEAHIEQGPVLEAAGLPLGIVSGIQGLRWLEVDVRGQEAHAGTTPGSARRDALKQAVHMARALFAHFDALGDGVRFTLGRWRVEPGSPNTVPGRVRFTIDLRHPQGQVLAESEQAIRRLCAEHAGPCPVEVTTLSQSEPIEFPDAIRAMLDQCAALWQYPRMSLVSGATHDAKLLHGVTATGMLFVPCEKGISHNQLENATPEHLAAGAQVLAEALVRLAGA